MNRNSGFSKLVAAIGSVALLLWLMVSLVLGMGLSKPIYGVFQEQLGVADSIGISQSELDNVTDVFVDYTRDVRDDLDVTVAIDGEETQMFNERETSHMVDVKNLFLAGVQIAFFLGGVAIVAFTALFFTHQQKTIYRMHTRVSLAFLVVSAALAIYFAIDFNGFWTAVHHLLFTNDLWLLNPLTDRMILMFPLNFFLTLSGTILGVFLALFIALWLFAANRAKVLEKAEA
ncbi:MAG: TIGR01906 family membrane protein [Eubacteriales bacterium]